jgi:hypothetical protein
MAGIEGQQPAHQPAGPVARAASEPDDAVAVDRDGGCAAPAEGGLSLGVLFARSLDQHTRPGFDAMNAALKARAEAAVAAAVA